MNEIFEMLKPVLGELMSILITLLIAWIKKRYDKKGIRARIKDLLTSKSVPEDLIDEIVSKVDSTNTANNGRHE